MASLRLPVKSPVASYLFTVSNILGAKISACAFAMVVGIGSNSQLLGGTALISFRMSSSVVVVKSHILSLGIQCQFVIGHLGLMHFKIFFILVVKKFLDSLARETGCSLGGSGS